MIQFTKEEMIDLRSKAEKRPEIIRWLKEENRDVFENDLRVPKSGIATWNLYYFCPECSVRLEWRMDSPEAHRCSECGRILTGEPYDGAWWRGMNGLNAKACYHGGLLWQLTREKKYLDRVREILLEYAKYYPDYEEHGGIPYNGPGKANAQTLCEANCHKDFTLGFDLVAEEIIPEERSYIEERLLREGAEFLMKHRSDQLHNHEVKISGTIGLIGLVLADERYLDFAVKSRYGLLYQLENGISKEGLWFEGSVHYHYYALQGLLTFEKAAKNTRYSNLEHQNFRKMLSLPLTLLLPNGSFPKLNDCIKGQEELDHTDIFEFAYNYYRDEEYGRVLTHVYKNRSRNNIDAFLYGADDLPVEEMAEGAEDLHYSGCGLTVFRGKENYLLLKHTPYGGEHDHYDRLGLILYSNGEEIIHDLGTTGYGAVMHYDYYKNTATHNTICVDGENHPPVDPRVIKYEESKGYKLIDVLVDWREEYRGIDSFTQVQWNEESYKDVVYRRGIVYLEDHFIEVVRVINPHGRDVKYCLHTKGVVKNDGNHWKGEEFSKKPLKYIGDMRQIDTKSGIEIKSDKNQIKIYTSVEKALTGRGPDNPSNKDMSYIFYESNERDVWYINLFDLTEGQVIEDVFIRREGDRIEIELLKGMVEKSYILEVEEKGIRFS